MANGLDATSVGRGEGVGATLAVAKGNTPSRDRNRRAMLRKVLAVGWPVAAVLAGGNGIVAGVGEPTMSGVSVEPSGGHVLSVDPASLAWAAGIRPGQVVVRLSDSSDDRGWALVTNDGVGDRAITSSAVAATLRLALVPAALAAILGLVGLVSARFHRRRAELLGAVGLVVATIPFAAAHDAVPGFVVGSAATLAGAGWWVRWSGHRRVGWAMLAGAATVSAIEAVSLATRATFVADIESIRFAEGVVLAVSASAIGAGMTPRAMARRSAHLRYVDVAAGAAVVAMLTITAMVFAPPWWIIAAILVVAGAVYVRARVTVRSLIERAVFAEDRERAAIDTAEGERARLSRELHDDPLQALTGVIMSLSDRPDTERERETLRTVAGQLRSIASALHPPVLDDLGLVPAVESLFAEQGPIPIRIELANDTGFRSSERPPFEVELAAYRIVAEAATNALRHSGCDQIVVRGHVMPDSIAIDVVDDGRGLDVDELERAIRDGHLGVASMRRRAEAIDASLSHVRGADRGTVVSLRWLA